MTDIGYIILILFSIYGIFSLFNSLFRLLENKKYYVEKANLVLLVNDQEENIERIIREAMMSRFVRNIAINGSFIVIDMKSKDQTYKILKRLEKQYPLIEVCSFDERESIFYK
ncbi:hypothetical protein [Ruminiclostridium josui]|uniref:hypothetical protein n=1 Tax=Ruminiclostridium josui TaxID=1499 RepID=UPI00046647F8|nr:hypothetical protein [Ruminiclostridium josui]